MLSEHSERRRLSLLVHDDLHQFLCSVEMRLTLLRRRLQDRDQQPVDLADVQELEASIRGAISIARRVTVELSPPVLSHEGLAAMLGWLAGHIQETAGLKVDLRLATTTLALPEDLRVMLFKGVRELLINVVRHAQAEQAWVRLMYGGDTLDIEVGDNGLGFGLGFAPQTAARQRAQTGSGLRHLREQLSLFDGSLKIRPRCGGGSLVTITVPAIEARELV